MKERYVALLRGINVGGHNIIAKDDLRHCFEEMGFTRVRTYIQSGNIVFRADAGETEQLTARVAAGLSERFSYAARAVVLSYADYRALLDAAPAAWGEDDAYRHNALFTLAGTTPEPKCWQASRPSRRNWKRLPPAPVSSSGRPRRSASPAPPSSSCRHSPCTNRSRYATTTRCADSPRYSTRSS